MAKTCPRCGTANASQAKFCNACGNSLAAASSMTPTGMLPAQAMLANRYIIVRLIGQGGMAAVYEAVDTRIQGKKWAIKEMSDAALTNPLDKQQAIRDFQREAQLLATLSHPNLPRVTDYFSERGKQYLVMEFVEGQTLEDIISSSPRPLDEKRVVKWGKQLCDVLEYLHTRQPPIIFRDLKPSNIMVDLDGNIKLIDFGIARLFKLGQAQDTTAFGTAGYAPPEQYGKGQTDARSDVYALGVVLHHLVTRHDPAADPFNLPPARRLNSGVSAQLESVILNATETEMSARYQSAADMRQALTATSAPPMPRPAVAQVVKPAPSPAPVAKPAPPVYVPAKSRPGCVTVYVLLNWLGAVICGLGSVLVMIYGATEPTTEEDMILGVVIGVILGGIALVNFVLGVGLWKLKKWAWLITMILLGLSITISLCSVAAVLLLVADSGGDIGDIGGAPCGLLVNIIVMIGLWNVREAFD